MRKQNIYTNPLHNNSLRVGDPFVYSHRQTYYLTGTAVADEGFQCWKSVDLVHWDQLGWIYKKSKTSMGQSHYWAPEVIFYGGSYYMVYSSRDKNTGRLLLSLAISPTPVGPFSDIHKPWFDFGYSAIDGHIFVDDDGAVYLYFSRNGYNKNRDIHYGMIYGVGLARNLSEPTGMPVKLMEANQTWEKVMPDNRCNEGPTVIKHNGRYYMTYSANHTCFPFYGIGYAIAENPLGPWIKSDENPIAKTCVADGVSGPGHNSIIHSPDKKELFMIYHTHANPNNPSIDRVVNIDRLKFDNSGKLGLVGPTRSPQPMPSGC